jgi:small membrane protein
MVHHLNLFQWIVVPFLSLLFLHSLVLMARGTHWRSAGVRALLWFAAAAAVFRPEMTVLIAKALGIGRGADLVLYLFIIGCLGAALYFYGRIVKLEKAITALVRQSALQDKAQTKS